ncbi:MAG: hypothetical protein JST87_07590 [Bacteroidetes bacterium]|nr:hypothetical protein [Bacteroidota bacterium]MBS1933009.1 hypothetical protein [Bacteroidota bacterium]
MIEVFKTNVQRTSQAKRIITILHEHLPNSRINFDLEDCDKVLRIDSPRIINADIITMLEQNGFFCEELQ